MISGTTQLYQARPISNDRIGQAGFKNRSGVQNKGHTAAYGLYQKALRDDVIFPLQKMEREKRSIRLIRNSDFCKS